MEADAATHARRLRSRMSAVPRERQAFAALFLAGFLVFLGLGVVIPVLPRYVKGPIGGGDFAVGLVTGAFAFTAVLARPIGGRIVDSRGRRVVFVTGALLAALGGALIFVPAGVPGLVVARLALGCGEGVMFTAGATWTVDLSPTRQRGRTMGLFGLAIWCALSTGPLLGDAIYGLGGYDLVWLLATALPLLGALLGRRIPDPHEPQPPDSRSPIVPREALGPGVALALANIGYAALAGFIVLHLAHQHAGGGAAVFAAFAISVVLVRVAFGWIPDRLGARRIAIAAAGCEAIGLALIGIAADWPVAAAGALLMGAGFSSLYPCLGLMVMETVPERRRGAALGAFTAFFDIGVGLGGLLAGAAASVAGYPAAFYAGALGALATAAVTLGPLRPRGAPPAPAR
jgi:MFS family permease